MSSNILPSYTSTMEHKNSELATSFKMDASSTYLPKYDPVNPRGEDSHFINLSAKTIGIADGFGGWEDKSGVEAGQYARLLMRNSESAIRRAIRKEDLDKKIIRIGTEKKNILGKSSRITLKITSDGGVHNAIQMGDLHPKKILGKAYSETKIRRGSSATTTTTPRKAIQEGEIHPKNILTKAYSETKVAGSSTVCLITLSGNILRAINVGDSGFVIVRDEKIIYQSPIQQHSFNNPYLLRMGNPNHNTRLAEEIEVNVELGDIIIAGTDGLFYNMLEVHLESVMRESKKLGLSLKKIASLLANLAQRNSFDTKIETPFSREAMAAGYAHSGGKLDDITVVVAVIRPSEDGKKPS